MFRYLGTPSNVHCAGRWHNGTFDGRTFIQRAQKLNFSSVEIGDLLKMRDDPRRTRDKVSKLTRQKLTEIETHLSDLQTLRKELRLLLKLCARGAGSCPIIEEIDKTSSRKRRRRGT